MNIEFRALRPERFRQFLLRNPDCCHGAWQGSDLPVGTIMARHDVRRGNLYHLAVKPGYRKQGIGRKLIETSLTALHAQGIREVQVYAIRDNLTASTLWENLGWKLYRDIQVYSFSEGEVLMT